MNRAGTTLVELIVALAAGSLVLAAAFASYNTMVVAAERTHTRYGALQQEVVSRNRLVHWLRLAQTDSTSCAWGIRKATRDGQSADTVLFSLPSAEPFLSVPANASLFVRHDAGGPDLVVRLRANSWARTLSLNSSVAGIHAVLLKQAFSPVRSNDVTGGVCEGLAIEFLPSRQSMSLYRIPVVVAR
jgi:hypothetical protein